MNAVTLAQIPLSENLVDLYHYMLCVYVKLHLSEMNIMLSMLSAFFSTKDTVKSTPHFGGISQKVNINSVINITTRINNSFCIFSYSCGDRLYFELKLGDI